ncbi:MAG: NAD kinase [Actinobacteria bacterium]|nr:NAD kinase [Actinomycetota bacterium]
MSKRAALLVVHPTRTEALTAADEFTKSLSAKGFSIYANQPVKGTTEFTNQTVEVVVVLGGDGTILRAAELTREQDCPILGVNLGHVGFLAEVERPTINQIVDAIDKNSFKVEDRMTLNFRVERAGKTFAQGWALNEVSVERNNQQMVELFVQIDHRPLSRWGCDAVICATPTGSTAYAYSAGGPVVWPEVDALVLLPLAAHALFSRPMVVSPQSEVAIDIESEGADLNADGLRRIKLQENDRVILTADQKDINLAHIKETNFTDRLVAKFKLPVVGWRG